eukprot:42380-Pleurochrysis_carterae.AAC.1
MMYRFASSVVSGGRPPDEETGPPEAAGAAVPAAVDAATDCACDRRGTAVKSMFKIERGYTPLRRENVSEFDDRRVTRMLRRQPCGDVVEPRP